MFVTIFHDDGSIAAGYTSVRGVLVQLSIDGCEDVLYTDDEGVATLVPGPVVPADAAANVVVTQTPDDTSDPLVS